MIQLSMLQPYTRNTELETRNYFLMQISFPFPISVVCVLFQILVLQGDQRIEDLFSTKWAQNVPAFHVDLILQFSR